MHKIYPCVLTIAGSDSSGGAGIQADIKAISATGGYASSVITALTAQNTLGVQAVADVAPDFIAKQLHSVFSDLKIAAVKIGMLHNEFVMREVVQALKIFQPNNIVLDPVMLSKNNCPLMLPESMDYLRQHLLPLATLVTPNLPEAEQLLGEKITTPDAMQMAAQQLGDALQTNFLIKGGHIAGDDSTDVLYEYLTGRYTWFSLPRIQTKNTHGTGCTLSASIASYLAQGHELAPAISAAKKYLTEAIAAGKDCQIGNGVGPVHHFYHTSV